MRDKLKLAHDAVLGLADVLLDQDQLFARGHSGTIA
jgi:hypothetical protein